MIPKRITRSSVYRFWYEKALDIWEIILDDSVETAYYH